MAVEGTDGGEDESLFGEIARIVDEIAGGEIVGAVGDDVVKPPMMASAFSGTRRVE